MSCDDYTYSPRGRGGLGVIQPQSGLDYPFISPSEDVRYLLADFYFAYDDPGLYDNEIAQASHPLKIKWLYGFGCEENSAPEDAPTPTHSADILIVDANDTVIFDSTDSVFTAKLWGDDYKIYEWQKSNAVCRAVVYTTWAPDEANTRQYFMHIAPESAVLDERAVYKMPKRVTSIKALNNTIKNSDLDLLCGYNIGMDVTPNTERGLRHTNEITMNAGPGLGIGRYSDCTDEPPDIVNLNGASGPDITIAATDCLWVRIDTVFDEDQVKLIPQKTPSVNPIQYPDGTTKVFLGSNCPACCDCADYVNTGRYMNCVRAYYDDIGAQTHEVLLQHSNNIERWLTQRECRIQKPLKVEMTPQLCPEIDVLVQYCNLCEKCAEDVNLQIQFTTYPFGGTVSIKHCHTVLNSGAARNFPYQIPTIAPNLFAVNFGKVSAGNSSEVTFRVEVDPPAPLSVTATVSGTKKEGNVIIPITAGCDVFAPVSAAAKTVALPCDNDGKTISVC